MIVIGNLIICFPRFEFCSSTPESILNSFPFCNLHNPSDRPMVGHIAENGMVIYDEFREGNISPCTDNYQFMIKCIEQFPKNKRIAYFRADAASYQKEI